MCIQLRQQFFLILLSFQTLISPPYLGPPLFPLLVITWAPCSALYLFSIPSSASQYTYIHKNFPQFPARLSVVFQPSSVWLPVCLHFLLVSFCPFSQQSVAAPCFRNFHTANFAFSSPESCLWILYLFYLQLQPELDPRRVFFVCSLISIIRHVACSCGAPTMWALSSNNIFIPSCCFCCWNIKHTHFLPCQRSLGLQQTIAESRRINFYVNHRVINFKCKSALGRPPSCHSPAAPPSFSNITLVVMSTLSPGCSFVFIDNAPLRLECLFRI